MRHLMYFFPAFVFILVLGCAGPEALNDPLSPVMPEYNSVYRGVEPSGELSLDITLKVKPGNPGGSGLLLAVAQDDTTSDSTRLYIDVEIENLGPQVVFLPEDANTLLLNARVSFVDFPHKKNFLSGKMRLVIGWTETGLRASEVHDTTFSTDSAFLFRIPLSRVDSLQVADNVAVYGEVLAPERYIIAGRVRSFETALPPQSDPAPDLVGFVRDVDLDVPGRNRLYVFPATAEVSDSTLATVAISDSTRIESSRGKQIALGELKTGANAFTVTAQAWAYSDKENKILIANGWEFRQFTVFVARALAP